MAKDTVDPIQEQLIAARENQILDAAVSVFAEKGFHSATIRDVAKAAGIADGTIYNYFENKTALLLGILNRMNQTDQREEDLAQAAEMDLRDAFEIHLRQRYAFLNQDGLNTIRAVLPEVLVNPELQQQYMEQIIEPTFALAEKHFARMVEDGKMRDVNIPMAMRIFSATFLGLLILRLMGDKVVENQWDELVSLLASMTVDGLEPR